MNGEDKVIKLLIAHTTNDRSVAEQLKEYLDFYGGDHLKSSLWEEKRQNRFNDIKKIIEDTDRLLIIVASAIVDDEDWSRLVRLTAMSSSMTNGHPWRILLHNKALTPPPLIQEVIEHSFNSEVSRIREFLNFFGSTGFTQDQRELNIHFTQQHSQVDSLAQTISSWFREPTNIIPERKRISDQIALIVNNPDGLPSHDSLTEEQVLSLSREIGVNSETPRALAIFNLEDAPTGGDNWSLEDIAKRLPENDSQRWLVELVESICSAHWGRINPQPGKMMFRASDSRLFRPILHEKERCRDSSERFIVLFAQSPNPGWVTIDDPHKATLLTALTLGARLQWEVCSEYRPQLARWQLHGREEIERGLKQVKVSFENIEEDARIRREGEAPGRSNRDRLRDSFDFEEGQIIDTNLLAQEEYKQILRDADRNYDVEAVKRALTQLEDLNKIVMARSARRYSELLNGNSH